MKSTLYIKCPQCRENGLLVERQGRYFCANCMYDYTQLKNYRGKLDEVIIENLQSAFGVVTARALYEWITLATPQESANYVAGLAGKYSIDISPKTSSLVKRLSLGILLFLAVMGLTVISVYFLFVK